MSAVSASRRTRHPPEPPYDLARQLAAEEAAAESRPTTPIAVCDVGSNGIRFGVLASLRRELPVLGEERAAISLYEAQQARPPASAPNGEPASPSSALSTQSSPSPLDDDRDEFPCAWSPALRPIPDAVLDDVAASMRRFAAIARRHGAELWVIATEATRTAPNSAALKERIREATGGREPSLLSKEDESTLSSLGAVATMGAVTGPSMDLGGGSLELNYLSAGEAPVEVDAASERRKRKPQSIPYGAAVVTMKLEQAAAFCGASVARQQTPTDFRADNGRPQSCAAAAASIVLEELVAAVRRAKADAGLTDADCDGATLYLAGGGFRAIGSIAIASRDHPFRTINGFTIDSAALRDTCLDLGSKSPADLNRLLRGNPAISAQRAAQIPGNLLIVLAALEVLRPAEVCFVEGGVRHGFALARMEPEERARDLLLCSAESFARGMNCAPADAERAALRRWLAAAFPHFAAAMSFGGGGPAAAARDRAAVAPRVMDAAVRLVHVADAHRKDHRAALAYHLLERSPLLGLTHADRAALLLILVHRYGGAGAGGEVLLDSVAKLAGGKKAARECKRVGRLLRLAVDVNATGALEDGSVALERADEGGCGGGGGAEDRGKKANGAPRLAIVVADGDGAGAGPAGRYAVDVPLIRRQVEKMNAKGLFSFKIWT